MRDLDLSVISPVLNEEFFLPLYLKSVHSFASEVLLLDGGSNDCSLDIIEGFRKNNKKIRLWQIPQKGIPYSNDWDEGKRRNFLLKKARGKWVLMLDVDEFLSDNFLTIFLREVLYEENILTFGFEFIPFWKDVNTVRLNVKGDTHWKGVIYRLIRRDVASYNYKNNHCNLLCRGKELWQCTKRKQLSEISLFHYHYALGKRIKYNDNRRGDVNLYNNIGRANWDYKPPDYLIKTEEYKGKHPLIISDYLGNL
jgi:glycosyltransferase involved in cell wall biosynthesis